MGRHHLRPGISLPLAVPFLSDAYFALAGDPDIATALGLGDQLIVMADGIAYGIVAEGEPGDPFTPPTTVATTVPTTIATGPGTTVPTVTPTTTREIPGITERPPPITTPATTAVATAITVAGTADGSSPTSLPIVLAVVLGLIGVSQPWRSSDVTELPYRIVQRRGRARSERIWPQPVTMSSPIMPASTCPGIVQTTA